MHSFPQGPRLPSQPAALPPMDGYGMPQAMPSGAAMGGGPMVSGYAPPSGSGRGHTGAMPNPSTFYSSNPHFAPGVTMPPVPEKPSPMAADPGKLWEINALKALGTHPHTYATRGSTAMACPDCDAQGVTLNYVPTEFSHGPLKWSSQLLHFVEAHGHDLPLQLRQMLPQVLDNAKRVAQEGPEPKACPMCGAALDMSLQGPRELMCFKCGNTFPPHAAKALAASKDASKGTAAMPPPDAIMHPPSNPHFAGYPSTHPGQFQPDPAIGYAPDPESLTHAGHPSKHRQRYIDLLAEMEQGQGVRKTLARTGVDCPQCLAVGYSIKIPVGTMSYRGVTWGAHLLHNLAVHGHPLPDDVKLALKAYKRETRALPVHDPSRHLPDRGDGRVAGGNPFTHFQPQTTAENIHKFIT